MGLVVCNDLLEIEKDFWVLFDLCVQFGVELTKLVHVDATF